MKPGIKVIGVEVSNFHRLRVARVTLSPEGGLVRVTGKNGAGKTSLLRSVKASLGGAAEVLAESVVHAGSEDGKGFVRLHLSNGFTVERRFTDAAPKGYLTVVGPDDGRHQQGKLNEWLGPLSFDPLAFFDQPPERQNEILLSLGGAGLPGELARLRARKEQVRVERTPWIVRKREALKHEPPAGERPVPVAIDAELDRKDAIEQKLDERRAAYDHLEQMRAAVEREATIGRDIAVKIRETRELLKAWESDLAKSRAHMANMATEVEQAEEYAKSFGDPSEELEQVEQRLRQASAVEAALRPWRAYDEAQAAAEQAREREQELTARLDELDAEETALLEEVKVPLEGLSFTEEGPQLHGRPLSVASGAERIRLAVAVAVAVNPHLRIALLDEANDMDLDGLRELDQLAREHDFQIWACRIGLEGPGEIVVDDGEAFSGGDS